MNSTIEDGLACLRPTSKMAATKSRWSYDNTQERHAVSKDRSQAL